MQISEITSFIESIAPLAYQEPYDNAGLLVGSPTDEVESALITLDVTEAVVDEAIAGGFKLIIAHHPLIFGGIKKTQWQNRAGTLPHQSHKKRRGHLRGPYQPRQRDGRDKQQNLRKAGPD